MRISFDKCDLVPTNAEREDIQGVAQSLGCNLRNCLSNNWVCLCSTVSLEGNLKPLVDAILKTADRWSGRLLSSAARLALIKSCQGSIPINLL